MRALALVLLLLAAAGVQAGVGTTTWDTGASCATDADGRTCSQTSESWTGAGVNDDPRRDTGIWLVQESHWSEGDHGSISPNAWNASREGRGVAVRAGDQEVRAIVTLREYSATQEADGKTRRTTENAVGLDVAAPGASRSEELGLTEHQVEGSVHRCRVDVLGVVAPEATCGQEMLQEPILP